MRSFWLLVALLLAGAAGADTGDVNCERIANYVVTVKSLENLRERAPTRPLTEPEARELDDLERFAARLESRFRAREGAIAADIVAATDTALMDVLRAARSACAELTQVTPET